MRGEDMAEQEKYLFRAEDVYKRQIQDEVHGCSRLEFMEISDENSSRIRLNR